MADAGIVKATFILSSKGMVKGIQDIIKETNKFSKTFNDTGKATDSTNKKLSVGQKVVQDLEKSTTMYTHQLRQQLNATKLGNKEREAFINTHRKLRQGITDGTVSVGKYHQVMKQLSNGYGLAYEKGRVFEEQTKKTSKLMANLQKEQIITPDKMLGSGSGMDEFARKIEKATAELREGIMTMKQYKAYAKELGKSTGVKVLNNGFVATPEYMAKAKEAVKNYTSSYDAMLLQQKRGLVVTDAHREAVKKAENGIKDLDFWVKHNVVSQADLNRVHERQSGNLSKNTQTVSQLTRSYGSLTNATNMVSRSQRMQNYAMQVSAMRYNALGLAVGALGGMIIGTFVTDFMMARTQSIKLDQQMQQMFQTMKLGKGAFDNFNKALDDYVSKVPKVSKYTVGSTIAQVGKLNNLSLDQMKRMIPLTGDMVNMMQLNGRTAEDTMLAINDAFDGQFKRLQEIGVQGKKQLQEFGYDGSADSLITALDAIDKQKGWSDLSKNVSTASDAFAILGNALDRIIVPSINLLTPAIVGISVAIANVLGWLNQMPTPIQAVATALIIAGGAFAVMKIQMAWARTMGSEFMASMTGLDAGMQRVTSSTYSGAKVVGMASGEFDQLATNMAELEHNASRSSKSWMDLNNIEKDGLVTRQKALLQYGDLSRYQKAQIQTYMRLNNVGKAEAMTEMFGAEAINARKTAQFQANVTDNTSIFSKMRKAFATGLDTGAEVSNTGATEGNTVAKTINVYITEILTKSSEKLGAVLAMVSVEMALFVAGAIAVAGACYLVTASQRKGVETMKEYNDFLENGEEQITKLKDSSTAYTTEAHNLEAVRDRLASQGQDTSNVEAQIALAYQKSAEMAQLAKNAEDALNKGREENQKLEGQHVINQTHYSESMYDQLYKNGLINKQIYDDQKDYNAIVVAGSKQKLDAVQRENRIYQIGANQNKKIMDGEHAYSKAFIQDQKDGGHALEDRVKAYDKLGRAKYKAETSTDWMTSISAWFEQGIARLEIGWIDTVMQFENFKLALGPFAKVLEGTYSWIVKLGSAIYDSFAKFAVVSGTAIWDGIVKGCNFVVNAINSVITWVKAFQNYWTEFTKSERGKELFANLSIAILELQGAWQVLCLAFSEAWSALGPALTNLGLALGILAPPTNDFKTAVTDTNTAVTESKPGLDLFKMAIDTIVWVVQGAVFWIKVLTPVISTIAWAVTTGATIVIGSLNLLTGAINWVKNGFNTAKSTVVNAMNTIWNKVNPVVTNVKNAFNTMKTTLVSSAKAIYDGVWTNHLKPLVDKIGEFWNKITNPGSWFSGAGTSGGKAGSPGMAGYYAGGAGTTRHAPGTRTSRNNNIFSGLGSAIKGMARNAVDSAGLPLDPRFQGYAGPLQTNKRIEDPRECQERYGKQCYAGGWDFGSDWIGKIKNLISTWSANIFGSSIPILDLANGKGNLGIFEVLANRLISGTHYDFYYNGRYSDKEALQRKAFNCWDGAEILMHLANGLGLSASMGRGTWNGYGHVWAVVNGKNFDTTAFQHGHGWTSPSVRGYAGPAKTQTSSSLSVKIDMRNSNFRGIDDVEKQMETVATKVFGQFLGKNPEIGF